MRLIDLKLKNFRQYKEAYVEFPEGLIGIIGPNGSGKSTLLEAIAWALYGTSALRGTKETVKWLGARGRTPVEVELEFELGTNRYQVKRSLEEAFLFQSDRLLARGVEAVTEKITQLLGMDYKLFFASYFTNQKDLAFLKDLPSREKAFTIARMLGYDRIERAITLADGRRRDLKSQVMGLEQGLPDIEELKKKREALLTQIEEASSKLKDLEREKDQAIEQWEQARAEVMDWESKKEKIEPLEREKLRWERDWENRVQEQNRLEKEISTLDAQVEEYRKIKPFVEEFDELSNRYQGILEQREKAKERREKEQRLAELCNDREVLRDQLSQPIPDLTQLENQVLQLQRELQEVENQLQKVRDQWKQEIVQVQEEVRQKKELREQIILHRRELQEAGGEGKCPTCKQPLGSVYEDVLHHFDEEIQKTTSQLRLLQRRQEELKKEPEDLRVLAKKREVLSCQLQERQKARGEAEVSLQNRRKLEEEYKKLERSILQCQQELSTFPKVLPLEVLEQQIQEVKRRGAEIRPYRDRALEIQNSPKELEKRKGRKKELSQEIQQLEERITQVKEEIQKIGYDESQHQQAKKREECAREHLDQAKERLSEARRNLESLKGGLKAVEDQIEEAQQKSLRLKEMKAEHRLHEVLSRGFKDFQHHLNQQIRPELAERMGSLLDDLTQGRYHEVDIDENYSFSLKEDGEVKPVISGGEEDILNLALRLAISQMIAERSGQVLNLLILDEVFGSLDDSRRANVVSVLQALRSRFDQIIVISHIETIHDMMDQCLWVEYDPRERCSRIRADSFGDDEALSLIGAGENQEV